MVESKAKKGPSPLGSPGMAKASKAFQRERFKSKGGRPGAGSSYGKERREQNAARRIIGHRETGSL